MTEPLSTDELPSQKPESVIRACATEVGCSVEELRGPLRRKDRVQARMKAACILVREHGLSTPATGRLLNRDHTTICHYLKKMNGAPVLKSDSLDALSLDREVDKAMDAVRREIRRAFRKDPLGSLLKIVEALK